MIDQLTDHEFTILREAVVIAKRYQIKKVSILKGRLLKRGYLSDNVDKALRAWGSYYAAKQD